MTSKYSGGSMTTRPAMKIIGLMLVRNEDWVLAASLRAALTWCDALVILNHASEDETQSIIDQACYDGARIAPRFETDGARWNEMDLRQRMLDAGRSLGGTHFAVIDADEIITDNHTPTDIRTWFTRLHPGYRLDVPMIPCWRTLDQYRSDDSVWSRADILLGFADAPNLSWRAADDGYQWHSRCPKNVQGSYKPYENRNTLGGVMHLQFANWPRLVAKHVWYRMTETIMWPGRKSPQELNAQYNEALDERNIRVRAIAPSWWHPEVRQLIDLEGPPSWHVKACRDMVVTHGVATFKDLNSFGII